MSLRRTFTSGLKDGMKDTEGAILRKTWASPIPWVGTRSVANVLQSWGWGGHELAYLPDAGKAMLGRVGGWGGRREGGLGWGKVGLWVY